MHAHTHTHTHAHRETQKKREGCFFVPTRLKIHHGRLHMRRRKKERRAVPRFPPFFSLLPNLRKDAGCPPPPAGGARAPAFFLRDRGPAPHVCTHDVSCVRVACARGETRRVWTLLEGGALSSSRTHTRGRGDPLWGFRGALRERKGAACVCSYTDDNHTWAFFVLCSYDVERRVCAQLPVW